MNCPRTDPTTACPSCPTAPGEPCPLAEAVALPGEAITAGRTGVCAVDNPECEECQ